MVHERSLVSRAVGGTRIETSPLGRDAKLVGAAELAFEPVLGGCSANAYAAADGELRRRWPAIEITCTARSPTSRTRPRAPARSRPAPRA